MPHLSSGCFAVYRISADSRWPKEITKQQLIWVGADCGSPQQNRRYKLYSIAYSVRSLSHQHSDPPFNSRSLLRSNSVNIIEFNLTPSLNQSLLRVTRGWGNFIDNVIFTLLLVLMAFVAQKKNLGKAVQSWDSCRSACDNEECQDCLQRSCKKHAPIAAGYPEWKTIEWKSKVPSKEGAYFAGCQ